MQSLDELRRVIRRVEARRPPRPAAPPAHEVLGGEVVETSAGPLVVVRREYPLTHVHGREPLAPAFTAPLELLSTVARAAAPAGDSRRLLFLDTETTGLAARRSRSAPRSAGSRRASARSSGSGVRTTCRAP